MQMEKKRKTHMRKTDAYAKHPHMHLKNGRKNSVTRLKKVAFAEHFHMIL